MEKKKTLHELLISLQRRGRDKFQVFGMMTKMSLYINVFKIRLIYGWTGLPSIEANFIF